MGRVKPALLYLYLLRAPMATLLLIWPGLAIAFNNAGLGTLFRGLADMNIGRPYGAVWAFLASFTGLLAVLAAVVSANLTLLYGELRINGLDSTPPPANPNLDRRFAIFVPAMAVYAMLLISLYQFNKQQPGFRFWIYWGPVLAGLAAVVMLNFAANYLAFRWASSDGSPIGAFLAIPFDKLLPWSVRVDQNHAGDLSHPSHGFFVRAYQKARPRLFRGGILWRLCAWIAKYTGVGYVRFQNHQPASILPGHMFAVCMVGALLAVYFGFGIAEFSCLAGTGCAVDVNVELVPTLAWVLSAVALICWILAGIGFYWDRYRVPAIVVIAGGLALLSSTGPSDHLFEVSDFPSADAAKLATPAQVLEAKSRREDRMILVAAAGGGIQAAAWTARVLTGLQFDNRSDRSLSSECAGDYANHFDSAVAAISGVSGGSVGTMFYLTTLPDFPGKRLTPCYALIEAEASSLEATAWGLTFPDFQRIALPLDFPWKRWDRGWALERAFSDHAGSSRHTMGELAAKTSSDFPVLLLNSTMTEQGGPVIFSNTRFPVQKDDAANLVIPQESFFNDCPGYQVNLETAVRMSATFSWVSPAARADANCGSGHLVDGGYYDNFGVNSLDAWLREAYGPGNLAATTPVAKGIRRALLVRIVSFPDDPPDPPAPEKWYYQLGAPLLTLYNARGTGQKLRDDSELWALRALFEKQGVTLDVADFQYYPPARCSKMAPPLSWHLTQTEKDCIAGAWTDGRLNASRNQVQTFLSAKENPGEASQDKSR